MPTRRLVRREAEMLENGICPVRLLDGPREGVDGENVRHRPTCECAEGTVFGGTDVEGSAAYASVAAAPSARTTAPSAIFLLPATFSSFPVRLVPRLNRLHCGSMKVPPCVGWHLRARRTCVSTTSGGKTGVTTVKFEVQIRGACAPQLGSKSARTACARDRANMRRGSRCGCRWRSDRPAWRRCGRSARDLPECSW
jgi:hypothetical protein